MLKKNLKNINLLKFKLKLIELKIKLLGILIKILGLKKKKQMENNETIEEMIRRIAKEEGVDPDLAVRVALCESGLDPDATRENPDGSVDRGLYQWNSYWHPEISDACAYTPECATRAFCKAVKDGNLHWWNSSRHCWER